MNKWLIENILYLSFFVTVAGATSGFLISDKTKRNISFIVALFGALVTLLSSMNTEKTNRTLKHASDSILTVNIKLQRALNMKIDVVRENQAKQYSEFAGNAIATLKKFSIVSDSLKSLLKLDKETFHSVKGSSQHPLFQVRLLPHNGYKNLAEFYIINQDIYPIHSMSVTFLTVYDDFVQITKQSDNGSVEFESKPNATFSKNIIVKELLKNEPQLLLTDHFPANLTNLDYVITFTFQNINYLATITFKKDGNYYKLIKFDVSNGRSKINPRDFFNIINAFGKDKQNQLIN